MNKNVKPVKGDRHMVERWKSKIQTGQIVTRLNKCANGEIEMTPIQLKAAEILLRKVMPDMKAVEAMITADNTFNVIINKPGSKMIDHIEEITIEEAEQINNAIEGEVVG